MTAYAPSSHASYRTSTILTASPEQLVIMLYDGCHRFLLQAITALREGNIVEAGERFGRATAIIDERRSPRPGRRSRVARRSRAAGRGSGR